jgi:hypothetical protein
MVFSEIPSLRLLGFTSHRSNLDPVYFQRLFTDGNEHPEMLQDSLYRKFDVDILPVPTLD